MAGTIPLSLTQQFDNSTHLPLVGGLVYFIQAGTTSTPQSAYQDSALTIPYANPYTILSDGRVPQLFFADGNIKIRIANSVGITQFSQDNLVVIGASSGGGGGGTVDPTTILATGDFKVNYGTGSLTGFVRSNGKTIGSATSGATERGNSDCQALFLFLWAADANLAVSTGRGVSAAADWAANKTIALPDLRGRVMAGMDDMGNSAASRLTTAGFGSAGTTLGAAGTVNTTDTHTLLAAAMPNHSHTISDPGHGHAQEVSPAGGTPGGILQGNVSGVYTTNGSLTASNTTGITGTNTAGSGGAHSIMQPTMVFTFYLKL